LGVLSVELVGRLDCGIAKAVVIERARWKRTIEWIREEEGLTAMKEGSIRGLLVIFIS